MEFQPMSPEERERLMHFLLNQQAQSAADSARVDATIEKLTAKTDRIADGLIGLTGIVGQIAQRVDQIAALQERTDQQVKETQQQLRETDARLTEHIKTVESHLDIVIQMFERHLREDHGHKPS